MIQDFETPQNLYVFATYYTIQRKYPIQFFISSLCFFVAKAVCPDYIVLCRKTKQIKRKARTMDVTFMCFSHKKIPLNPP